MKKRVSITVIQNIEHNFAPIVYGDSNDIDSVVKKGFRQIEREIEVSELSYKQKGIARRKIAELRGEVKKDTPSRHKTKSIIGWFKKHIPSLIPELMDLLDIIFVN